MRKILFPLLILSILCFMSNCDNEPIGTGIQVEPEKIYSVIYDVNGNTDGEVPVDNNLYAEGDVVRLLSNETLIKSGFTNFGWHYNKRVYKVGESIQIYNDIILYAFWVENE